MDKYRRVEKSKAHDAAPTEANEIRITQQGNVRSYISYANGLFTDKNERGVVLKAMGNAISKAVTVAEILKHRVELLHQITQISSVETVDVYEPLEEGLDRIETKRHIPSISIQLSLDPLSKDDPGYQSPIPVELVFKGFDGKEPRKFPAAARKKKKSKATAASGGSSPQEADGGDADADADGAAAAAGQEHAKSRANTVLPASAAAASSPATDEDSESPPVEDGKPAARGDATKRGRTRGGHSGGRGGAGRKPREDSSKAGEADGASDEAKPASPSPPSDPSTSKKANRSRKPRPKPDASNGEASGAGASANADTSSPEQVQHGEGEDGGRTSSFRGRGRGRGGRGRGRGRGRGGRGEAASTPDAAPVAASDATH